MPTKRMLHLECARGIASIIVILHHFSLAFFPVIKEAVWSGGARFTPVYVLLNGSGAVVYFFMLSGFVLTLGFYRRFSAAKFLAAVLKRLPRLVVPAGASILLGYLILKFAPDPHIEASIFSGSNWLKNFGAANIPGEFEPSLADAFRQSICVFLHSGDFYYNSNLWTMYDEFYGSLLVFGLVAVSHLIPKCDARMVVVFHIAAALSSVMMHKNFLAFVVGSFLAFVVARRRTEISISTKVCWILLLSSIVAFSVGKWIADIAGSTSLMLALLGNRRLADRLSGKVGKILGDFSFPLYLVHTLIIVSLSSAVYVYLSGQNNLASLVLVLTLASTLFTTAVTAIPFVALDKAWVSELNKLVLRLTTALRLPVPEKTRE